MSLSPTLNKFILLTFTFEPEKSRASFPIYLKSIFLILP